MRYYISKRRPDGTSEVQEVSTPSDRWDEKEEAKLTALAEGARRLVRDTHRTFEPTQTQEVRQKLINDILNAR